VRRLSENERIKTNNDDERRTNEKKETNMSWVVNLRWCWWMTVKNVNYWHSFLLIYQSCVKHKMCHSLHSIILHSPSSSYEFMSNERACQRINHSFCDSHASSGKDVKNTSWWWFLFYWWWLNIGVERRRVKRVSE
jgi:hypothetical protein